MIVSSASFSAVAEAQNVLKELRDRANRALQESKRFQQEAGILDNRAERLITEAHTVAGECVALTEECNRQEAYLLQLPERLAKATGKAEDILTTWGTLDDSISKLYETQTQVNDAKQVRIAQIRQNRDQIENKLQVAETFLLTEVTRLTKETENVAKAKLALEFRIADARTSCNAANKALEEHQTALSEARLTQDDVAKKLAAAQQNADEQSCMSPDSVQLQQLRMNNEQLQRQYQEEHLALASSKAMLSSTLEEQRVVLENQRNLVEILRNDISARNERLQEQRIQQQAERERLENQLFGITKEREILQAQELADKQAVDKLAGELTAQWNARIASEVAAIASEQSNLVQKIEAQRQVNKKEQDDWEARVRAKTSELQKAISVANEKKAAFDRQEQARRASSTMRSLEDAEHVATVPEDGKPKTKKSKAKVIQAQKTEKAAEATVSEPPAAVNAIARSKSVVAKLFETATGFISGKGSKQVADNVKPSPVSFSAKAPTDTSPSQPQSFPKGTKETTRSDATVAQRRAHSKSDGVMRNPPASSTFQLTPVSSDEGPLSRKAGMERIKTPDWVNIHNHGEERSSPSRPVSHVRHAATGVARTVPNRSDTKSGGGQSAPKGAAANNLFNTPTAAVGPKYSLQPVMTYARTKTVSSNIAADDDTAIVAHRDVPSRKATAAQGKRSQQNQQRQKQKKPQKLSEDEDQSSASQFDLFG